jgi:uncharacterized protein (TIGR02466 family)
VNPSVYPLFATPIMASADLYSFSEEEKSFIRNLEYAENIGNRMSRNTHILDCPELEKLKSFIDSHLQLFARNLLQITAETEIYITQSWSNIAGNGQFHPRHKHPNSLLSGVIYVSDDTENKFPPIRFHRSADVFPLEPRFEALNEFNSTARWFAASTGKLILFPSTVEHDVGENQSADDRISISFNTFVKGIIGDESRLTLVEVGAEVK